jgi:hypothetical protein
MQSPVSIANGNEMKAQRPTGIELTAQRRCPRGFYPAIACDFCENGHQDDCHYPQTCKEALCSHHLVYKEIDG